ncbi:DUF11 domain-containing protein [Chondromyces crocatus]|uniref:DUF11 domain-containing protein n=1 Tax=Chondromyces crocatus TaxID=52 RepID=UPI00067C5D10|nr:DUF11 domain-containing protein [Chondromyces crocatus]
MDQRGDFLLIGNTLGQDCAAGIPAPVVGTVGNCGSTGVSDSAPDVFWRVDDPNPGNAVANNTIAMANARSTAMLTIPPNATVSHAYLYWGAKAPGPDPDTTATLSRPGGSGFNVDLTAIHSSQVIQGADFFYQSVADVTQLVQEHGSGAYRVSGVTSNNFINATSDTNYSGWWMVVFYERDSEPPRNLALFDGLDRVGSGAPQSATLSGFFVPPAGYDAKLGVVAYEGDDSIQGDQFFFNSVAMTNGQNPANNFFNNSRTHLGNLVSVVGDLPQLTGGPRSLSGLDIDVLDITAQVSPGLSSAPIQATSTGDVYFLGGFVTSISTFKPDFSTSVKTAVDVNGGSLLPGDVIQYTINVINTGNDTSTHTVLTDPLPAGVTYVPGSLSITSGANSGPKTDAAGDDQAEYNAGTRTLTVRLGTGANATQGGTMIVNATATVTFRVTVNANASGTIANQAIINAAGEQGAPATDTPTDGNGPAGGSPPTEVVVDQCESNAGCSAPTPYCDTTGSPKICVECITDMQCSPLEPTCDSETNTCSCVPTGPEVCGDGIDNNCDGVAEEFCVDTDGDGLPDDLELQIGTDPNDADTDDDGVPDGMEASFDEDIDGDGLIGPLDPDSDNDGLFDGTEMGFDCSHPDTDISAGHCIPDGDMGATTTDPLNPDTDGGSVSDGDEDRNRNGVVDAGETDPTAGNGADDVLNQDTDGDGLSDIIEITIGTDPNDADSDDDGVPDGQEIDPGGDADGDGIINALDPDSDNDGIFDGTEMGFDCSNPATDVSAGTCVPDADQGATTTNPLDPDTDHGGVRDGVEDANKNGRIDAGETDPNNPADDVVIMDSDGDGLPDDVELQLGTDPFDADSDDDGVPDGQEINPGGDADGDGLINALDPDSDNDGLFDGTEMGFDCSGPGTDVSRGHCRPDADQGATTTDPLDPDTDDGGVSDGNEDTNLNGRIDEGETDPNDPSDDNEVVDSDGDGLSDQLEIFIGTDPNDADSDDDGVLDGDEPNFSDDHDGDGLINALDPDSDDDGLFDGTEMGLDCSNPATDTTKNTCIPDADGGATTTNPLDADTDDGGVIDGEEDTNKNGQVDPGERDPNDPSDDNNVPPTPCTEDSACGGPNSGSICDEDTGTCVNGCRGTNGNSCPSGQVCSSTDDTAGTCSPDPGGPAEPGSDDLYAEGNGLLCSARPGQADGQGGATALTLVGLLGLALRLRRKGSRP